MKLHAFLAVSLTFAVAGCDLEVPDLNNPSLTDLEENPTQSGVYAVGTGLLIDSRAGISTRAGYVAQLGVLGREAYNLDAADPRPRSEILGGQLESGSPFGGAFWALPYATIRDGNILLNALAEIPPDPAFSEAERAGIRGYVKTLQALAFLQVVVTHDATGAVLETNVAPDKITDSPIVTDVPQLYTFIADLLDDAAAELATAGDATYQFPLSSGFEAVASIDGAAGVSGDDLRAVNRGLAARVALYREQFQAVLDFLDESFVSDDLAARGLEFGAYHAFSTGSGDARNGLVSAVLFAHPSFEADVQSTAADVQDTRFTSKIAKVEDGGEEDGLASDLVFTIYASPSSPIPMVRNEELLLIRAEANFRLDNLEAAATDLNLIRTASGGLEARDDLTAENFEAELLYNRRYSLMWEGGHRWIDMRRLGRTDELPLDRDGDIVNEAYPLPQAEKLARGLE